MKLQVSLVLIYLLYPQALALKCYQCIPGASGTCTNTQIDCPDQCAIVTTDVTGAGIHTEINTKTCGMSGLCISGSLNLGTVQTTLSSRCCSTDLCNNQSVPVSPQKDSNGRLCYSCSDRSCTGIVNCVGDENRCISISGTTEGARFTEKGCATRSYCDASVSGVHVSGEVSCCEGNLCNSTAGVTLSVFIMLGPVLSSFFFLL